MLNFPLGLLIFLVVVVGLVPMELKSHLKEVKYFPSPCLLKTRDNL